MTPAPKRRWFRFAFSLRTMLVVVTVGVFLTATALAWRSVPVTGALTFSDIWAIRKTVAHDPRTQDEPILEISESDGVAEVVVGVQVSQFEGKGRIVCLQKRHGKWTIVTFSRWSLGHDTEPLAHCHWRRWGPDGKENEP